MNDSHIGNRISQ